MPGLCPQTRRRTLRGEYFCQVEAITFNLAQILPPEASALSPLPALTGQRGTFAAISGGRG